MFYCSICDKEIINVDKHLIKYHKLIPEEKNNEGSILCSLCNIKVRNLYRHYFSTLHRYNILVSAVNIKSDLAGYTRHLEKFNTKEICLAIKTKEGEEESPFWTAAKEELNEEDYRKLKEYIVGNKEKDNSRRYIKY